MGDDAGIRKICQSALEGEGGSIFSRIGGEWYGCVTVTWHLTEETCLRSGEDESMPRLHPHAEEYVTGHSPQPRYSRERFAALGILMQFRKGRLLEWLRR